MLAVIAFSFLLSSSTAGVKAEPASSRSASRATHGVRSDDQSNWIAPDGKPGFGYGRARRDIERLLRSPDAAGRALLEGLRDQVREVEIELAVAHARYDALGYYEVLGLEQPTPEKLGTRFEELSIDVPKALRSGGKQADVLARLLSDPRFRARARAVDGVGRELSELRGALALFQAHTDGWADLSDSEIDFLAQRADLAAARLRAIRLDLIALHESPATIGATAPWQPEYERLLLLARAHEHLRIETELFPMLERLEHAEAAMAGPLFTTRLALLLERELAARAQDLAHVAELLPQARELDPDAKSGLRASKTVAALSKSERRQRASRLAQDAVALDPTHEEALWLAASTSELGSGATEALRYYDRYLALRGIRGHDHRTYQGRTLTREENKALQVVQANEFLK